MTYECNAIIKSVSLDDSDRDLLSGWLHLDYGGSGQGFGGYALYLPANYKHTGGPNFAGHFIWRCMKIGGVTRWQDLPGKTIRVRQDQKFGSIIAIGHIVENDWFNPTNDFETMKKTGIAVPEDHVLVPRKMTHVMWEAMHDALVLHSVPGDVIEKVWQRTLEVVR